MIYAIKKKKKKSIVRATKRNNTIKEIIIKNEWFTISSEDGWCNIGIQIKSR